MPAEQIQEAAAKLPVGRFSSTIDGYFLPKSPAEIFAAGEQAHVPLLVGWNTEENSGPRRARRPTSRHQKNFTKALGTLYGDRADEARRSTPARHPRKCVRRRPISPATGSSPTAPGSGLICTARPAPSRSTATCTRGRGRQPPRHRRRRQPARLARSTRGARRRALGRNRVRDGQPRDQQGLCLDAGRSQGVEVMQGYFANFVKTGNPNGAGLPQWPAVNSGASQFMRIDVDTHAEPDKTRDRYLFLDLDLQQAGKVSSRSPITKLSRGRNCNHHVRIVCGNVPEVTRTLAVRCIVPAREMRTHARAALSRSRFSS